MNDLIATIPFGGGELKIFTGKPPPLANNAAVDQYSHTLDASRYGIVSAAAKAAPPAPDPSWPAGVQEAHKALYAELPQYKTPDANGQFGYIAGNVFFDSVQLNEAWMAQIEAAQPVRKSAWEKLKGWVRGKDNVR